MFSISINWLWIEVVAVLICFSPVNAQSVELARYEVRLERDEAGYEIAAADATGLFLHRTGIGPKFDQIDLIHIDTALREKWKGVITIEKNYRVFGHAVFQDKLYLLLRYRDYTRKDLILFSIDNETGNYFQYKIKGYIPFAPTEFHVMPKGVAIGGYFNRTPLVLFFSLEDYRSKVLPGLVNESGELTQIRVNADETFDVVLSTPDVEKKKSIRLNRYDFQGNLIFTYSISPEENKHLIFGRIVATEENMQILAGVYGSRSAEYSRGIFISTIDPVGSVQTRYYSFGDLENFFKFMKAKREKRVKDRIERRRIKGKMTKFNYRFLLHEVIPYQDQYLLLGEAFYPKYTYVDRSSMMFAPRMNGGTMENGRIFDGYYYTHAVIMSFNNNGDLLWDNSFEIKDVKSFKLEQFVKARLLEDKIALFYIYDNKLRSKIIHNNEVLEAKTEDLIQGPAEGTRSSENSVAVLKYWFNDVMYANGIEDIESPGGRHKRRVFYINKIQFQYR